MNFQENEKEKKHWINTDRIADNIKLGDYRFWKYNSWKGNEYPIF